MLGQPAGFKPNTQLSQFIGNYALMLITASKTVSQALEPVSLIAFKVVPFFGTFGLSTFLAALHDLLFCQSYYQFFLYTVFARVYRQGLAMAFTLFKLFRGQKRNVIRGKEDEAVYNISELYFGVLMISLIIFLLPTVAMFYFYCFLSVVVSVLGLQFVLIASQTLILNFPYYLLVWTSWDKKTLSDSININYDDEKLKIEPKGGNRAIYGHLGK
jgi:phosphatidylinositol N-acetylglucosaminyltransferase subunit Q